VTRQASIEERLARLDPAQRAALAARLARRGPQLAPRPGPRESFPPGMDQERLWLLDQMYPGTTTYTLGFGLRLQGEFDMAAFTDAVRAVVARHELLRCGIETGDTGPRLVVHPERQADLTYTDLSHGPAEQAETRRAAFIAQLVSRPFDLARDPVLRIAVAHLGGGDYQIAQTMPHSFTDQWTYVRLNRELMAFYRANLTGTPPNVPDLPVQYGDYAQWQRDVLAGPDGDGHRAFWSDYLRDVPRLDLPYDDAEDTTDHAGRQYHFVLADDVAAAFVAKARSAGVTVANAMVAVHAAALYAETGQRDLVIGVPSVTRSHPYVQDMAGFLLTNLPLRLQLPPAPTPDQILAAAGAAAAAVAEHRETPFGEIVKAAAPDRQAAGYPLLQTMLVHLNLEQSVFYDVPGARVYANAVPEGISSMDMTVAWWQLREKIYGRIEYRTALFDDATVALFGRRLLHEVRRFVTAGHLPLASPASAQIAGTGTRGAPVRYVAVRWRPERLPEPDTMAAALGAVGAAHPAVSGRLHAAVEDAHVRLWTAEPTLDDRSWQIVCADLCAALDGEAVVPEQPGWQGPDDTRAVRQPVRPRTVPDGGEAGTGPAVVGAAPVVVAVAGTPGGLTLDADIATSVARAARQSLPGAVLSLALAGRDDGPSGDPTVQAGAFAREFAVRTPAAGASVWSDRAAVASALRRAVRAGVAPVPGSAVRIRVSVVDPPRYAEPLDAAGADVDVVATRVPDGVRLHARAAPSVPQDTADALVAAAAAGLATLWTTDDPDLPGRAGCTEQDLEELFAELSGIRPWER
jgi:hypothetical protein